MRKDTNTTPGICSEDCHFTLTRSRSEREGEATEKIIRHIRGSNPKTEGRRPKEGRSPKAETNPNRPRRWVSVFGFRNSAFFRPSGFGLRPLKLPHPSPRPRGAGALAFVARDVWRPRFVATRPIVLPLLRGEGRGEGERGSRPFHSARSSEPDTLQTRFQFLAALGILVRSRSAVNPEADTPKRTGAFASSWYSGGAPAFCRLSAPGLS